MKTTSVVLFATAALLLAGCSNDSDNGPANKDGATAKKDGGTSGYKDGTTSNDDSSSSGDKLTITAKLTQPATKADSDPALVGYALYCVTLGKTAASAKGTSGSDGAVSLTLPLKSADLGCFILDSKQKAAATVTFQEAADKTSLTVKLSASVNFGLVPVDLDNQSATVQLPTGASLVTSTPADLPCPLGLWYSEPIDMGCSGKKGDAQMMIAKDSADHYVVGVISGPISDKCIYMTAKSVTEITEYKDSVLTMPVADYGDKCDPGKRLWHSKIEFNEDCSQAKEIGYITGCGSCTGEQNCEGCGSAKCDSPNYVAKKK